MSINGAIYAANVVKVRKLSGADRINKLDAEGYAPLVVVAAANQQAVVEDLLSRCASAKLVDPDGYTAFLLACKYAGVTMTKTFLDDGNLIQSRCGEGSTPLMISIFYNNPSVDVAEFLLESTVDVDDVDNDAWTALHLATNEGNEKMAQLLLDKRGAQIES